MQRFFDLIPVLWEVSSARILFFIVAGLVVCLAISCFAGLFVEADKGEMIKRRIKG